MTERPFWCQRADHSLVIILSSSKMILVNEMLLPVPLSVVMQPYSELTNMPGLT